MSKVVRRQNKLRLRRLRWGKVTEGSGTYLSKELRFIVAAQVPGCVTCRLLLAKVRKPPLSVCSVQKIPEEGSCVHFWGIEEIPGSIARTADVSVSVFRDGKQMLRTHSGLVIPGS